MQPLHILTPAAPKFRGDLPPLRCGRYRLSGPKPPKQQRPGAGQHHWVFLGCRRVRAKLPGQYRAPQQHHRGQPRRETPHWQLPYENLHLRRNGDYEVYTYDRYGRVATIAHYDHGVIFSTFVAGIYHNPLYRVSLTQLFQKWDEGFGIRPVCGDIISNHVLADRCHIHVIPGLSLPVLHVVFLHVHKGRVRIGFAVAVPVSTDVDIQIVPL